MKSIAILIIIALFMSGFCYGQGSYLYSKPKDLGDGWKTNTLKSQNVDTTLIHRLFSQLHESENKIHSVLLTKGNQIIIEEYLNGQVSEQKHDLRSSTKSIISILLGIAIDKGFIDDVNDPISKYLKSPIPKKILTKEKKKSQSNTF